MSNLKTETIAIGAAALNLIPLDFDHNSAVIQAAITRARLQGIQILCLPELCLTGYGCEDGFFYRETSAQALRILKDILPKTKDIAITCGLPLWIGSICYNAIAFVVDGKIQGFVCKQHLANYGIHYEARWFAPWEQGRVESYTFDGQQYPCGDIVFDLDVIRIGLEICHDAWVENRPGHALARKQVDIILNPSASHFAIGKVSERRRIVAEGSDIFSAVYVYANLLGNESGRVIYDGDTLIAQHGQLIVQGPRFEITECAVSGCEITLMPKEKTAGCAGVVSCNALPKSSAANPVSVIPSWEKSVYVQYEEFARAVSLGLFDYMRKSRAKGFVLSLSGGADSGCIGVLTYYLAHRLKTESTESFLSDALSYWRDALPHIQSTEDISYLLHCVYQGTENSSSVTLLAAQELSRVIRAQCSVVSIQGICNAYLSLFQSVIGREPTWEQDDLALQNIQARVRSPGIWLVANMRGALLLTTSNRSEASVGYATMDGDTSGGLAPIVGVSKHFVREFLLHMQTKGLSNFAPLPVLEKITKQSPTAELRPLSENQTDEDDLMPYLVLDRIERLALEKRFSRHQVLMSIQQEFRDTYPSEDLTRWVDTFYRLWKMSQWKRERTAPSFHLDEYNVDPRSWLRFPILSGGLP